MTKLTIKICSHSTSKEHCGKILNIFTSQLWGSSPTHLICEVIDEDFFLDLHGKLEDFLAQIPGERDQVHKFIVDNKNLNLNGEIIDSDEDEQGNLR
jgi:hypothetical protein